MIFTVLCALITPQSGELPPHPLDRVVELELTEGEPCRHEYLSEFEGTLHVWTMSGIDLSLRVEDSNSGELLAEDLDSGGGDTPYIRLEVEHRQQLVIQCSAEDASESSSDAFSLHLIACPETEETREVARNAQEAARAGIERFEQGDMAGAHQLMNPAIISIGALEGAAYSQVICEAARELMLFEQVLEHRQRTLPNDHPELRSARETVARWLFQQGDFTGASALFRAVFETQERVLPDDHPDRLRAGQQLADSTMKQGDLAGARILAESVLEARTRTLPDDHPSLQYSRQVVVSLMDRMGDAAGACVLQGLILEVYERALPADDPDLAMMRTSLANLMCRTGDFVGARALFESVLETRERTLSGDHADLMQARRNLATVMSAMGEFTEARELDEAVLASYERTLPEDDPTLLKARSNLATSMYRLGEDADARALLASVLESYERTLPDDHPDLLLAREHLAVLMSVTGDLADARVLLESALDARERTLRTDDPKLLANRDSLARTLVMMNDFAGARALVARQCEGMTQRVLASLTAGARQVNQTVAMENQRLDAIQFLGEGGDTELREDVFELTETMRLVVSEAARMLAGVDEDSELAPILDLIEEIRRAQGDLIGGAARSGMSEEDLVAEITRLSLERDRLERRASALLVERGVVARPVDLAAMTDSLGENEAFVGFRRLRGFLLGEEQGPIAAEEHLFAQVLRSDGTLTRVDLGRAGELEDLANEWRSALGAALAGSDSRGIESFANPVVNEAKIGSRVRARLLDPISSAAGEGVTKLFVCPDDFVYLLPLDALPLDEKGQLRSGDRITIVNEVSCARLLAGAEEKSGERSLLVMGGVDYDAEGHGSPDAVAVAAPIEMSNSADGTRSAAPLRFPELPAARVEAREVSELFASTFEVEPVLLEGEQATKATLFDAATGTRFVHLATHGWFAPDSVKSTVDAQPARGGFMRMSVEERVTGFAPMTLCGLALVGANRGVDAQGRVKGILTAEELCTLDLSACELAVLSACETNVGVRRAGQGIQSLQAALYAAGAQTSITSLWKVDDSATRRLMELFYENLWIKEQSKAEALWNAKATLRKEGHPPAHWAGWVMTGDPN